MLSVTKYTEDELVDLLQKRREEGFSYLYDHYSGALYAVICSIVGDESLGADVLQEVFLNIFKHIDNYDVGKSRLYTWMLNIARNAAIDLLRSKGFKNMKQNREINETVYEQQGGLPVAIDHIGIRKFIGHLKEELRQVIDLAYFNGYTQEQISEMLHIPVGTVKTRVRTALKQLRELMT